MSEYQYQHTDLTATAVTLEHEDTYLPRFS